MIPLVLFFEPGFCDHLGLDFLAKPEIFYKLQNGGLRAYIESLVGSAF